MDSINKKALNAGIWYVVCNVLTNGMYLITTPVFTRLLSKDDYGITVTYSSWVSILTIIATLDLYNCIQLSKVEYEKQAKEFLSSILFLSSITIFITYVVIRTGSLFVPDLLGIPQPLIDILFAEILFKNAYTLLQTQHRVFLKYKEFVAMTIVIAIAEQLLAVSLTFALTKNRYLGRILGNAIPFFLFGLITFVFVLHRGKKLFHKEYWLFGLKLSLPLIPHHLSGTILTQFDKLIITSCFGYNFTALYSIANSYTLALQIILNSLNNAWIPWFYEKMKNNDITTIRKAVKLYTLLFSVLVICVTAAAPEAILLLGGAEYMDSIRTIPPIASAVYFQFLYSLYVNIEFYYKKTRNLALWSILAAVVNIVLNNLFVPRFGYTATAYTTLAGYILLFVLHYLSAGRLDKRELYSKKFLLYVVCSTLLLIIVMYALYPVRFLRYSGTSVMLLLCSIYLMKNHAGPFAARGADTKNL